MIDQLLHFSDSFYFLPDLSLSRSCLIRLNQEQTSLQIDILHLCPVNTNLGSKILNIALKFVSLPEQFAIGLEFF